MKMFQVTGAAVLNTIRRLGRAALFLYEILGNTWTLARRFYLVIQQVYAVGVFTLPIVLVSGLFVGMVLGLQGYNTLVKFGSAQSLGLLVALSLLRELGPVVTALLFAGRAGSALTAEIGLMKATEQLAGMEMMAVNPVMRVIAPRFLAGVISMPLLAAMFSAIGVLGGNLVGVGLLGVDSGAFWSQMQDGVDFREDVMNGVYKSWCWRGGHLDRRVRGLRCRTQRRRRQPCHQPHRGLFIARRAGARFHHDRINAGRGMT
jgi:phospholipid/cholesterol/gamma-HCH transport system permease protein